MPDQALTLVIFGASTSAPREGVVVFSTLLERELPARGVPVRVFNAGIPGNTSEAARGRFERDVLSRNPDIVTLQLGLNDSAVDVWKGETQPRVPVATYRRNMLYFIRELRARGARPILLLPQPIQWTDTLREYYREPIYDHADPDGWITTGQAHHDALRQIAREQDLPVIDLDAIFRAYAQAHGCSLHDLFLDGMHPNSQGHGLIADTLMGKIVAMAESKGAGETGGAGGQRPPG